MQALFVVPMIFNIMTGGLAQPNPLIYSSERPAMMAMLLLLLMAANSIGRGIYERANASSGPMS